MNQENSASEIKEHVKDTSVWMRVLYMALFAMLYWVAEVVIAVVVLFQFLSVLFTGKKNDKVLQLGAQLSTYAYQIFSFLTYNSEVHPFPMGEWPSGAKLTEGSFKPAAATGKPAHASSPAKSPAKRKAPTARAKKESEAEKPETPAGE